MSRATLGELRQAIPTCRATQTLGTSRLPSRTPSYETGGRVVMQSCRLIIRGAREMAQSMVESLDSPKHVTSVNLFFQQ